MTVKFLEQTTFIHLRIRQWSGSKRLGREESGIKQSLSDKVVSMGIKRLIDPQELKIFDNLKKKAERLLYEDGQRLLGGYAVSDVLFSEKLRDVNNIRDDYFKEVDKFKRKLDTLYHDWLIKNPNESELFSNLPSAERVRQSFDFIIEAYKLDLPQGMDLSEDHFADQLLHEVGKEAQECWSKSVSGKKISQRFITNTLPKLYNKLNTLAFGNGKITRLLEQYDKLQHNLPHSGGIDVSERIHGEISHFLLLLANPSLAQTVIDNDTLPTTIVETKPVVINPDTGHEPMKPKMANDDLYF